MPDEPDPEAHWPTEPTDDSPLPVGPPRYQFLDEIGRGDTATVYRARDTTLNHDVAVKVPHEPPGSEATQQVIDEARITGQLQHPGIPAVHDLGTLPDGRPFLVMKLIKGDTLAGLLRARPDPSRDRGQFVAAFEQACQAVAYAHAHNVRHGDLEPTNVMVGAFGEVQVIDWGLATVLANRDREGAGGDLPPVAHAPGSPAYMSPEQAIEATDQIDARSDVFGLGAILCAILTGQPPYVSDTAGSTQQLAARAKLDDALARLDACDAEPKLVALCKWCLKPEKADRPADAGQVAHAVASLRTAAEDRARRAESERATTEAESRDQRKRRRVMLALAAAMLLIAAGGAAVAWRTQQRAAEERHRLARNREAIAASLDRGETALRSGDTAAAAAALEEVEGRWSDGGGEEFRARVEQCRAELPLLEELDRVNDLRWSPVGGQFPEPAAVAERWRAAFAGYGIVLGTTPPDEAAQRVRDALIADHLLAALDLWLVSVPSPALAELLHAADPDDYRDAIRATLLKNDPQRLRDLAAHDAAEHLPARFAVAIGAMSPVTVSRRRAVLQRALADRPGDLSVLMELGGTYPINQREGADERVRWYQAAAASHPTRTAAWNNLGVALADRGESAPAIAALTRAVRLDPNNPAALVNLGIALRDRGDLDDAVTLYRRAVWVNPNSAIAHYHLGLVLRARSDPDGAIAAYREATRLDPRLVAAHYNLGMILAQKQDWKGAAAAYREALRFNRRFVDAHVGLGSVLWSENDFDGAIAAYTEATRINPQSAPAHFGLGIARRSKGDLDGAIAAFREAVKLDPDSRLYQRELDAALKQQAARDAAIAPPPREVKQR